MDIYAPIATGIPAWATRADLEPGQTAVCEFCGVEVDADDAVRAMGREFCSEDCLWDWTADHREEVIEWLKD